METETAEEPVLFFKRSNKSKNNRKRPATPPSDSESEYSSEGSDGERTIKRRRRNTGAITAASKSHGSKEEVIGPSKYAASRSAVIEKSDDATKQSNWFDKNQDIAVKTAVETKEGVYTGAASYQKFVKPNPNASTKTKMGPVKAPTNIRTITVTDFAPDVCKDYKQTGFCGFGDSCKFLHAREDYKQGWQLDRDWEIGTKGKKQAGTTIASANRSSNDAADEFDEAEEKMLEKIPFACVICKESYTNPIVTTCQHYFCENCALQRYKKTPSCAICGSGTGGVFNGAKGLKKLLEKKQAREEKKAAAEREKAAAEA